MSDFFEVIVSNIGKTHQGTDEKFAHTIYQKYVAMSKAGEGRAAGQDVALWKNNAPIAEHRGTIQESN